VKKKVRSRLGQSQKRMDCEKPKEIRRPGGGGGLSIAARDQGENSPFENFEWKMLKKKGKAAFTGREGGGKVRGAGGGESIHSISFGRGVE